jgi:pimeloyl-ACP methyl ester carboxylesterase
VPRTDVPSTGPSCSSYALVMGPGEAAAAVALLRVHQGDPTGVHVVWHSRGCDQMLNQLNQHPDVRVDRLVTLDCFGLSGSCGEIPDTVGTNLNYW